MAGMLIHLLCLLSSAPAILCAAVRLTSPGQSAILGSEFSFTCTVVDGNVMGLISFKRRDDKSFPFVCRVEVDSGNQTSRKDVFLCSAVDGQAQTYSLTIRNVSQQDSTVWQCVAGGTQSNDVTLNVLYAPTVAIEAVSPCSGFTFLVDESNVALNCTVKGGIPAPNTFTWYHGNVTLQQGASPVYAISRVTRSSGGWYRCTADNGISPLGENGVTVNVHYPPIFTGNGTKNVVNETEDVTIQCATDAEPNVTSVVWTKEGRQISGSGLLHLRNIQKDAAGVYVCTATNEVTPCSGIPQTKTSSVYLTLEVQYAPRVEYFGVTSGNRTTTVREHDNVTLRCDVSSYPASTTAIRNRTSSIGSSRTSNSVIHEGYRQTLTTRLLHVSCLEGGDFTCAAGNLMGKASQTVSLQVRCVPRRDSPSSDELVFTSSLHENVTLSLTVIAFPQPTFTWRRVPKARPISPTEVVADGVHVTGSVTIYDVRDEDYINYTVSVINTEGRLDLEMPLLSKSRPHQPNNLKAVNIRPHSVTLGWDKAFNGGATQRFNIQYRQPGGQWTTHPTSPYEDNNLQLDIDGLEPGTVYEIRINAQNEYGASDYTSTIVVETESASPSGVPVYVVVIACVMSVLLTAALYKAVKVGWAKRKSSTHPVTTGESEGYNLYQATTRDMNVGENAYDSLALVEAAVYVNTDTNNQPRPTSSASAAPRESQSPDPYYSMIKDSAL